MSHQVNEQDLREQEQTEVRTPGQHAQDEEQHQSRQAGEHDTMDTGQVPGTAAMSSQFAERPSDAAIAEIEEERRRRLQHRPPNAEIDNTHRTFNPELGRFEDCEDPIHFEKPKRR